MVRTILPKKIKATDIKLVRKRSTNAITRQYSKLGRVSLIDSLLRPEDAFIEIASSLNICSFVCCSSSFALGLNFLRFPGDQLPLFALPSNCLSLAC